MKHRIKRQLRSVYELEPVGREGEELAFCLWVYWDGDSFSAQLMRWEFFRVQPSFPQTGGSVDRARSCDEMILVRDSEVGALVEELRSPSEEALLEQVDAVIEKVFSA